MSSFQNPKFLAECFVIYVKILCLHLILVVGTTRVLRSKCVSSHFFILNISTFSKTIVIIDKLAYSSEELVYNLCLSFENIISCSWNESFDSCVPLVWYPRTTNWCWVQFPSEEALTFHLLVRGTAACFIHGLFASKTTFVQSGDEVNDAVSQKTWTIQSKLTML